MNIDDQFESFLAGLGVEMERKEEYDALPEVSIFQASRDHYGVFYRLDLIDHKPELRIMVPVDQGDVKMDIYLVRLSDSSPLNNSFKLISSYSGSKTYENGRDATLQHMLYAVAETMKTLFWSGDLQHLVFPQEIEVHPLLLSTERKTQQRRFR